MRNRSIRQVIQISIKTCWFLLACLIFTEFIVSVVSGVVFVEIIRRITDAIWQHQYGTLEYAVWMLVLIKTTEFLCRLLSGKVRYVLSMKLDFDMEDEIYRRYVLRDSWPEVTRESVLGHMRKTVPNTAQKVLGNITGIEHMLVSTVSGISYGMVQLNPCVTGICMIVTVGMLLIMKKPLARVRPEFRNIQQLQSKRFSRQMELIGNREVGSFLCPEKTVEPYIHESGEYIQSILHFKKLSNGAHMFSQFGSIILIVLAGMIGGTFAVRGQMSFADLLATIILIPSFATSVFAIPSTITSWKELSGSLDSLDEVMNAPMYNTKNKGTLEEPIVQIDIENLQYSYGKDEVLHSVSMNFKPGLYCICGLSGCGKSTFLKLMARVMPYDKGSILVNGIELNTLDRKNYWNHITYIEQKFTVFSGTLRENITMNVDANEAELQDAIEGAGLQQYTSVLPDGVDTWVEATKLSSGENLKIGIARALYLKREVVFLDEVMEALDPTAEVQVARTLRNAAEQNGSLIICVSHRSAVAEEANHVVFMKKGTIAAVSTHAQLMDSSDDYRSLWRAAEVCA